MSLRSINWSNLGFGAALLLLGMLGGWWTVFIHRLLDENYTMAVAFYGASAELAAEHDRRRMMLMGESLTLLLLALLLIVLALEQARRERRMVRQMESLFAASTHELKTPVAGVRSLLESLQSGVLPPARMAPFLARGLEACTRLEHLIEGILAWQAAQARPSDRVRTTVQAQVSAVLEHRFASLGAEKLSCSLDGIGDVVIEVAPDRFRVILENLLDNARKYGEGRDVKLSGRIVGPHVALTVTDQGAGFAPGDSEVLFEPYRRGRSGEKRHGTGLGLYIARSLARGMGGDLRAESPGPGQGATFTFLVQRELGAKPLSSGGS